MPVPNLSRQNVYAAVSNEELVRLCQYAPPDDSRSFELLVARYKGLVYKTALRLMGNPQDADDQAQEIFLRIYRNIKTLDDPKGLTTWIYRIATNTCLDALRKSQSRRARQGEQTHLTHSSDEDEIEIADPQCISPEQAALRNEIIRCLEQALAQAEPANRAVLTLRDIEERPYDEIAKILGIGLSAVKMRIHRARLVFKELLDRVCPDVWTSRAT
jgi:RNA polymerase sigma-70 factor, ECF subfamily